MSHVGNKKEQISVQTELLCDI